MKKVLFIAACALACVAAVSAKLERDYQVQFNQDQFQGQGRLEVVLVHGRADIVTDQFAIEVDFAGKWVEAIEQSLRYAHDTKKKPGIALIVGKSARDITASMKCRICCWLLGITMWVVPK